MNTAKASNFIAILNETETAGAIVYWRMSGSIDTARLQEEWLARGLDPALLPRKVAAPTALHRAMCEQTNKHRIVRPLGQKAWALVEERVSESDTATLDAAWSGEPLFRASVGANGELDITPSWYYAADKLRADYAVALRAMSQTDVSHWLTKLVDTVDAIGLRDTGGLYFVPRHTLDAWRLMTAAIRAASAHTIFAVPAMKSEETVAAVVDAVTSEAEAECEALDKALLAEKLGPRALDSQLARTNAAEAKLERYEAILGQKLEGVRARLTQARVAVTTAILMAAPADAE